MFVNKFQTQDGLKEWVEAKDPVPKNFYFYTFVSIGRLFFRLLSLILGSYWQQICQIIYVSPKGLNTHCIVINNFNMNISTIFKYYDLTFLSKSPSLLSRADRQTDHKRPKVQKNSYKWTLKGFIVIGHTNIHIMYNVNGTVQAFAQSFLSHYLSSLFHVSSLACPLPILTLRVKEVNLKCYQFYIKYCIVLIK